MPANAVPATEQVERELTETVGGLSTRTGLHRILMTSNGRREHTIGTLSGRACLQLPMQKAIKIAKIVTNKIAAKVPATRVERAH